MAEAIPVVRLKAGIVVDAAGVLGVNVDGSVPPVWWPAGYIPEVGDAVRVLLVDGAAMVMGPVTATRRPLTGTVSGAASSGRVPVDTIAGTVQARYVGAAPTIGTLVFLDWQATTPRIMSTAAAATVPTEPTPEPDAPAPPPVRTTGTLTVTAIDSGTFNTQFGSWSSFYGTHVIQGTYGGELRGAWFYGDAARQLAGATITAARIRLGARRRMGDHNAALGLNLHRHTSGSRPGGDVSRVAGPHTVTLAPSAPAQWVSIPAGWGQALVDSGGGLGVAGGTYGGVDGVGSDPASGQIQLDWQR